MAETKKLLQITDLNDDCLTEISKFLDIENLYNLYKSNRRFYIPIRNAVPSIQATITGPKISRNWENIENFLQVFGNQVRDLHIIECWKFHIEFYEKCVNKYCSGNTVRHCTFSRVFVTKDLIVSNARFFRSLKSLKFDRVALQPSGLAFLHECKEMSWQQTQPSDTSAWNIYDELLVLLGSSNFAYDEINNSPRYILTKSLSAQTNDINYSSLMKFPNIVTLECELFNNFDIALTMQNLNHLKEMRLFLHYIPKEKQDAIISAISSLNTLKSITLRLDRTETDDNGKMVESICAMTNLEELCLKNTLPLHSSSDPHLLKIANSLKKLKMFHYEYGNNETILYEFLRRAKGLKTLILDETYEEYDWDDRYEKLCDDLVTIREEQSSKYVLYVKILDCYDGFFKQTKWVKMRIFGKKDYDGSF